MFYCLKTTTTFCWLHKSHVLQWLHNWYEIFLWLLAYLIPCSLSYDHKIINSVSGFFLVLRPFLTDIYRNADQQQNDRSSYKTTSACTSWFSGCIFRGTSFITHTRCAMYKRYVLLAFTRVVAIHWQKDICQGRNCVPKAKFQWVIISNRIW